MGLSLPDWLARRSDDCGHRLALVSEGARWSFRELNVRVDGVAAWLQAQDVRPGDRVALLLGNGPLFVGLTHAVPRAGGVLVPLNVRLTPAELGWQLRDCEARVLVHDAAHAALAAAAASGQACRVLTAESAVEGGRISSGIATDTRMLDLDTLHSVVYTSGTTGRPKGAMLTFGNHWWSATASALNLGLQETDRWLAILPLFHVGGLSILLKSVIYGIPAVVHAAFDPAEANRAIDAEGATVVSVVSVMLQRMLEERGERPYPSRFRCALLGGGPAPRPLLEACAKRGVPVVQTYGLTETSSQIATLAPADAMRKLGSAGKPLLPADLRIERESGHVAAPGEPGEIVVRGPMVTAGYLNRPRATAEAMRGGWLHTGDIGYLDEERYLYVLDRRDDLIISGGENVYPAEVEAVLLAHPAVAEAGVIGVPEQRWGQVPVAVVRVRGDAGVEETELIAFASQRLARYKVPTRIVVTGVPLPRSASGKLRRVVLRQFYTAGELTSARVQPST